MKYKHALELSSHHHRENAPSLTVMKDPPPSRRRRPSNASQSKKLKLVISFNGAFNFRPPTGKLRYVGGETRIVSLDRNAGFSKLRSKILDLCPNVSSFSLRYQFPDSEPLHSNSDERPLVLIDSEDDFRCMIDEYDKFVLCDKHARLRIFVCNKTSANYVKKQHNVYADRGESGSLSAIALSETVCGDNGLQMQTQHSAIHAFGFSKAAVNFPMTSKTTGARCSNDLLRKLVLKQRSRTKQSALPSSTRTRIDNNVRPEGKPDYDHPLIDVSAVAHVPISGNVANQSFDDRFHGGLYNNLGKAHLRGGENYGTLAKPPASRAYPLNPRDGNLRVEAKISTRCLSRQPNSVVSRKTRFNIGISRQPVARIECSRQLNNSCAISPYSGFDAERDWRSMARASVKGLHRENTVPWTANYDSEKTADFVKNSCDVKSSSSSNRTLFDGLGGSHDHSVDNAKHQTNHQNDHSNQTEMENHRAVGMNGKLSIGICNSGLRPISDISKQGLSIRSYNRNTWRQGSSYPEQSSQVTVSMLDPRKNEDNTLFDAQNAQNDNCIEVGGQILEPCISSKPPSPCYKEMENQVDVLNGIKCRAHEVPYLYVSENNHKFDEYGEPSHFELQKEHLPMEQQKNAINHCHGDRPGFLGNSKLPAGVAAVNSNSDLMIESRNSLCEPASSVDIYSYNLSLSSCTGVEPSLELSSCASEVLSEPLQKFQTKCRNLMGKEEVSDLLGLKSNEFISTPSLQNVELQKGCVDDDEVGITRDPKSTQYFDKKAESKESKKSFKVIRGISLDLIAFYTHLATRELQTIKNFDLEYIKELGSGTYGTVFYGKWKGSDVAIKKIKQSCLSDGLLEQDRLLADFWKEAHILGQLHHPNIVAFYGVVTDGPATNLATVTEYMVNGSLKQVLQRKDRTIDRRKRLTIAMDAAFGMEYLHEKNIVHFDLKSHNLLVNMKDPQRPICKIGDLGLSKIKQRTLVSGSVRGTIPWMAPELLNNNNNLVTEKVDVYSLGIVMWELLTGEEPYSNLRSDDIIAGLIRGNLRPEIPSWCEPSWRLLMQKCWSTDPDSRPPFSEIAKELRSMSQAMNIK